MIKENRIRQTSIGALIVQRKKGHNYVEVGFRKTFLINLAEWVNLLAIVGFLTYCFVLGYHRIEESRIS